MRLVRITRAGVTTVISLCLIFSGIAKGNDERSEGDLKTRWDVMVGAHHAKRDLSMHYEYKNDPASRSKEIGDSPADIGFQGFGLMSVGYAFNDISALEFEYSNSSIDETGVVRQTVRFFGFPLRLALRIPVELSTESFKLRYAHTILRTPDWRLVGTVGIRDLKASATYLHADFVQQTDHYQAYLPTLGALLSHRLNDSLMFLSRIDYFPIRSKTNRGYIGDIDLGVECRLLTSYAIGLGYRYSSISFSNDKEKSRGDLSYVTQGPMAYFTMRY